MIGALRTWWRQRAAARLEIDAALWPAVEARLPFLDYLDAGERAALRQLAREFIVAKEWSAAGELQLTPAIQLGIALQACLPILKLGLDWYDGWVGIVVYPGDFVIPRQTIDEDGVVHEYDDEVMGEAWYGGPVLISWFDQPEDTDGVNVVIHEFAHKLDMRNGEPDGLPPLHAGMSVQRWAAVWSTAYERFCADVDAGVDTGIDEYAAESPAEFFAVMSECFFEIPDLIQQAWPDLYEQLARFYRLDPAPRARALFPPDAA